MGNEWCSIVRYFLRDGLRRGVFMTQYLAFIEVPFESY